MTPKSIIVLDTNTLLSAAIRPNSTFFFAPPLSIPVCRDPKDDKYLTLALAAKAKVIVTGDLALLILHPFQGIPILKSSDFLEFNSLISLIIIISFLSFTVFPFMRFSVLQSKN